MSFTFPPNPTNPGIGPHFAHYFYDFTRQGGAQGDITLLGDGPLPANAMIIGQITRTTISTASGGLATTALRLNTAGDLLPAAAFGAWFQTASPAGGNRVVGGGTLAAFVGPLFSFTAANSFPVLLNAAATPVLTVADADLTDGAFDIWLEYLLT